MFRRLAADGLVEQHEGRDLVLTVAGRAAADGIFRRHALLEWLLTSVVGLGWAESDEEAGRLQGEISPRVEASLDELLGHPPTCPHGNPIDADTARRRPPGTPLDKVEAGQHATIYRITEEAEEDAALLSYLEARALTPGAKIHVLARSESLDSLTLEGPRGRATLGLRPAGARPRPPRRRRPVAVPPRADPGGSHARDMNEAPLQRVGAYSAFLIGAAYLVITILYVVAGLVPTTGTEAWLGYLADRQVTWWGITGFSVLTDLLFFPFALALYVALRAVDRPWMLAGTGLLALFAILDLAVTWPNYAALIELAADWSAAAAEPERQAALAAAAYPAAVLDSKLFPAYVILVPALGILAIGVVMLRGQFGRVAGALGVLTGLLGVFTVAAGFVSDALGSLAILTSVLTTVWILFAGYGLLRTARS